MLAQQRHQQIINYLKKKQFASLPDLSAHAKASVATIRRDVSKLEESGKLLRIRGGAELSVATSEAPARFRHLSSESFQCGSARNIEQKRRIAAAAAALCEDEESLIINGGTTTHMMAETLRNRSVSILTNSFSLALALSEWEGPRITMPGGEFHPKQSLILNIFEDDITRRFHASKMFIGTPAITDTGVREADRLLIRAAQNLRRHTEQLIVLADSSKLGKKAHLLMFPIEEVDLIITDSKADSTLVDKIEQKGTRVIVVE